MLVHLFHTYLRNNPKENRMISLVFCNHSYIYQQVINYNLTFMFYCFLGKLFTGLNNILITFYSWESTFVCWGSNQLISSNDSWTLAIRVQHFSLIFVISNLCYSTVAITYLLLLPEHGQVQHFINIHFTFLMITG